MNGQGPNMQPGFPGRPNQPRPKFNFKSKDVKKEITPDFMAAQLASFGSSAKLKSLPGQQVDPSKQQPHQVTPGFNQGFGPGFPQMNQGFRQPMMPAFQGQAFMQPQGKGMSGFQQMGMQGMPNMSSMPNMSMGMQAQFASGNPQFSMAGPQMQFGGMSGFGAQTASLGTATQTQQPTAVSASAFPTGFQPAQTSSFQPMSSGGVSSAQTSTFQASFSSPTSSFQASNDMFGGFNTTANKGVASASTNDPFANLRSSGSSTKPSSTDVFSTPAPKQEFDAFGATPFNAGSGSSSQASSKTSQNDPFTGFDSFSAISSNSASSLNISSVTSAANYSAFSTQPTSGSATGLDSMFAPQPPVSVSTGFTSNLSTAAPTSKPASQFSASQFSAAFGAPSESLFDSMTTTSAKPEPVLTPATPSQPAPVQASTLSTAFDSAFCESSGAGFGFDSSFNPTPTSKSKPPSTSASFSAFDDDFTTITGKHSRTQSGSSIRSFGKSGGTDLFSGPKTGFSTPPLSMPSATSSPSPAQSGDMFSSSKAAVTKLPASASSGKFDPFGGTTKTAELGPPVVDKYSVFSALSTDFTPVSEPSPANADFGAFGQDFKAEPAPKAYPEVPVKAFDDTLFESSFDPFSEKKAPPALPARPAAPTKPDPFTQSAGPDPFTQSSSQPDPFNQLAPQTDIFGQSSIAADPFGQQSSQPDPFAQSASNTDPFAQSASNADPFAQSASNADPFGQPSSQSGFDQFDVFSQLSSSKPAASEPAPAPAPVPAAGNSIVRQRPAPKSQSGMMVVLPPPSKLTERKKPSKPGPPAIPAAPQVSKGSPDLFDPFSQPSGGVETDGAAFAKPARPAAPQPSKQHLSALKPQQTSKAPTRTAKRRAPPPPSKRPSEEKKEAIMSLLDLDFSESSMGAQPPASSSGAPPPQPLLILPTAQIMSKGAPPSRPPPPKAGDEPGEMMFVGQPPPLPPRPGPGHALYHHILKTGPYCVAVFEFEAENDDELDFKAGDQIRLESDISDEWFAGSIGRKRGIFPKNCVDVKIPLPDSSRPITPAAATISPSPSPVTTTIDWGAPQVDEKKDIFNAWGDSRTPSPPPTVVTPEPVPAPSVPTPEPVPSISPDLAAPAPAVPDYSPDITQESGSMVGSCTAIYSFVAQESDELTIQEGDLINVLEFVDDDWIRGEIDGKVGIFPRSYASFGEEEEEEEPLEEILDEQTRSVNVFYDFEAGAEDELSLSAGDMVQVISTVGEEWIKGRFQGKEGIFPACFVPAIPDHWNIPEDSETFTENFETTEESSSSSSSSSSDDDDKDRLSVTSETRSFSADPTSDLGSAQVIADFDAENDFEMSVKTGDIVKITAKLNDLWLEGECNGNTGILPINFVKWLDGSPEPNIIGNPAVSDGGGLERQDTLKSSPEDAQSAFPEPIVVGNPFTTENPFAAELGATPPAESDVFNTGDLPPPAPDLVGGELETTLVSENPFTSGVEPEQTPPQSGTPTVESQPKSGDMRRAVYAFESQNDDELPFEQGDVIEVTEYLNEDWLRGKCNGKEGLFPISFTIEFQDG